MSVAKAGTKTYPPKVLIQPAPNPEQLKYERLWEDPAYRELSPGENSAQVFLQQAKPLKDSTCIDFGCGTGRGGLMAALFGNMIVTLVDFAGNALDEDVKNATVTQPDRISWLQADLTKRLPTKASYGYCVDVMEHILPDDVETVLRNVLSAAQHVFFQISTADDLMGGLHLTVEPYNWWLNKLRAAGAVIHWSQTYDSKDTGEAIMCQFYVSSWIDHDDVVFEGAVNTETETVKEHIRENAKTEWQLIHPHISQDTEIMMVCGGPSLPDYTDEIIKQRAEGMPLVTANGTYNWALEHGMTPSMQLIIDAREFNKRFVEPVVDGCKYIIASQCHPEVFKGLPEERTYIWHTGGKESDVSDLLDELYEIWFPCPGGSTVTLRGLCLLRMLGFHKIHMYGFDSCYREGSHHAYPQPENNYDPKMRVPVSVGGKVFQCDAWMFCQAREWMKMTELFGDEISLNVKGDGLIAHIIKTGATLSALEENEE